VAHQPNPGLGCL